MASRTETHLLNAIQDEARKLILRYQRYAHDLHNEAMRIGRRAGRVPPKEVRRPGYWSLPAFDPFHVRAQAGGYAHALARSLERDTYKPWPAVSYDVPKSDGTMREVNVFSVADNAFSRLVYKGLLAKNCTRFSARCYAYRTDLTVHDAITHIASEFRSTQRLFIAEFDFSKFFDSISHDHILRVLDSGQFLLTNRERRIIESFLRTPTLGVASWTNRSVLVRERGIPQGTSLSLFLANAAASPLDRTLERMSVGFARYADDTIIWSTDYSAVLGAVDALSEAARLMGVQINLKKSGGISLVCPPTYRSPELASSKASAVYLGYGISQSFVSISPNNVEGIKKRIAEIVFRNLLEFPSNGILNAARVDPPIDRDYYVMILQIRRYLYGDVSELQLRRFFNRTSARIRFRGLMSFYPLVDHFDQLKALDGWMVHTIATTLKLRGDYFVKAGVQLPRPHGLSRGELLTFQGRSTKDTPLDLRIPSFVRMARLMQRVTKLRGANAIANPKSFEYYWGLT
ncbi:MAG: reverse transcriptase domain-containing protein [Myxococcales bacterium]